MFTFRKIVNLLFWIALIRNANCIETTESNNNLQIISRNEWKADPPTGNISDLNLPMKIAVIIHTASEFCDNKTDCSTKVKEMQNYHMKELKFDDIGYNFLISGNGLVYEGRGWNKQGAHTRGYNNISLGIALIGNFMKIKPTKLQLIATQELLQQGIELKKLSTEYKLFGHRQLRPTLSPGDNLYEIIKNWEHWSEFIDSRISNK